MSNFLGMLIGAAIDRQDGDSGIKGAIIGSVVQSSIRVLTPVVLTFAVGWAVQKAVRSAFDRVSNGPSSASGEVIDAR